MNYYNEIKQELINSEIYRQTKKYFVNKNDLNTYYKVGEIISKAERTYGNGIIKEYSQKLKIELERNYSVRLLYKMVKYYNFISKENLPTLSANLSWSHYDELLKFDDKNKILYYIDICVKQNLSIRQLREKIKSNEYERLPNETKNKLEKKEIVNIVDFIKNPIIINDKCKLNSITEKILQKIVLR